MATQLADTLGTKNEQNTQEDTTQFRLSEAETANLTDWVNEPSVLDLKNDLDQAKPAHDNWVAKIKRWNDLMGVTGPSKPIEIKGRSSVQPKLIRRQAEWRYSALTEPFLSANKLYQVNPRTFEDQQAATQNELVLNWQFDTKFNKVQFIDNLIRATVDEGTCVLRIGWNRVTKDVEVDAPRFEHYAIEEGDQHDTQMLMAAIQLAEQDPNGYNTNTPPEIKAAVDYYNQTQQPTIAKQVGTEKVTQTNIIENRPTAEVLNPSNFYLDPSCNDDIEKALFAVVAFETTKATLLLEPKRYKNLDRVNWSGSVPATEPNFETNTPNTYQVRDDLRRRVVAYEYWGWYDIHKTGELVPIVATWIGNTLIRLEENPFPDGKLPFVLIPYLPVKRSVFGEPDAELLEDNQKIIGAITRGMIDLLGRSANAQQGIAKGMLDPLNLRKFTSGQDYEFNPNTSPANNLIQHKYPEFPQSALQMLNLQNQDAEALTGVKSFSGGISGAAYGDVAAGIRGALDASSKREMAILRRLAKGMSEVGEKFASMNAVFLSQKEVIRITNNQFVTVNRDDLKGQFDLEVDIDTAEIDDQKAKDLAFMLQTMGPKMPQEFTQMILAEIADIKRMPDLAQKIRTYQPQPDPFTQQMQQLQLQEQQKKIDKLQSEVQLNEAQAQALGAKKDQANLDYVEQETGTKHARDMAKMRAQAEGNQNLEVTKAILKPGKEGEKKPDIAAGVGFNKITQSQDDPAPAAPAVVPVPQPVAQPVPVPVSTGVPPTNGSIPPQVVATTTGAPPPNPGFNH